MAKKTIFGRDLDKCEYDFTEITIDKVGRKYTAEFVMWQKVKPNFKIEVTVVKPTLAKLKTSILGLLELSHK